MAGNWVAKAFGKTQPVDNLNGIQHETALLLVQGKNTFGDDIYTYVKLPIQRIEEIKQCLASSQNFVPGHYGTVVAAGRGKPLPEVKEEMGTPDFIIYFEPTTLPNQRPQG